MPRRHSGAMTHDPSQQVVSIGYEWRSSAELIEAIPSNRSRSWSTWGLTPISRKPGLSKTALAFNRTASNMCTSASWQPQSEPAWIPKR